MILTDYRTSFVGTSAVRAFTSISSNFNHFITLLDTTLTKNISGNFGLLKKGTAVLTLGSRNSYTGTTEINGLYSVWWDPTGTGTRITAAPFFGNYGTLRISGSAVNTSNVNITKGGTIINGSSTIANNISVVNRINPFSTLNLYGGTFTMIGPSPGYSHTQSISSLSVSSGYNILNSSGTSSTTTASLSFTDSGNNIYKRSIGSIVNCITAINFGPYFVNAPTESSVSGSGTDAILIGAHSGNDFIAAKSGIVTAASYVNTLTTGKNLDVIGNLSSSGNTSVNSVRFNTATKTNISLGSSDTLTIDSGSIIVGSSAPKGAITVVSSITGGNITSSTNELLVVTQNQLNVRDGAGVWIGSKLVNNGINPLNLNIVGSNAGFFNGAVILSNPQNSFTGNIYLNCGTLMLQSSAAGAIADSVLGGSNTIYATNGYNTVRADLGTTNAWSNNHNIFIDSGALLDISSQNGPITVNASISGTGVLGIGMGTYNAAGSLVILPTNQNNFYGTYLVGVQLRANEGIGLSSNANLLLARNGAYRDVGFGILETSANFVRPLGTGAGQVRFGQMQGNSWGGGFSAVDNPIIISLGGIDTPQTLTLGSGGFMRPFNGGTGGSGLVLQNNNANNTLTWKNPINNNGYTVAVFQTTSTANQSTSAIMTGVISGTGGFIKDGAGILGLSADNTYTGATNILSGLVYVNSINSVVGGLSSSSLGAPTTIANGTMKLGAYGAQGANAAGLIYVGQGETTDRVLSLDSTVASITLSNSNPSGGTLKFTSNFITTAIRRRSESFALILGGTGNGEISGNISNSTYNATLSSAPSGSSSLVVTSGDINFGYDRANVLVSGAGIAAGSYWTSYTGNTGTLNTPTTAAIPNGQDVTFIGTYSIQKTGSGTWTLGGNNTYTGATSITSGTLITTKLVSGTAGKFSSASFTSTTLTVTFSVAPLAGETYRLFPGSTTQTYSSVTLVGATGRTATYNSTTSTLTIA